MAKNQESGKASPILEGAWDEYRDWAALARQSKRELRRWRIIVLVLGVIGAALETLAATSIGKSFVYGDFNVLAILGFVSLALAAFFGRNVLGGKPEQTWVTARSVAEALKSEVFKYCTRVPPYDKLADRDQKLAAAKNRITERAQCAGMLLHPSKRAAKPVPKDGMSIDEYIKARIDDQIDRTNGYYWTEASEDQKWVGVFRIVAIAAGALSAVLGGLGAYGIVGATIWVAVVTTFSSSVAAYFQAGRFEYLVMSYSATARRLQNLVDEWRTKALDAATFVSKCEEAFSSENQSWMAEWLHDKKADQTPANSRAH
jgi:hypothetical protein